VGIHPCPADATLIDVTTAITEALDRPRRASGKRSDLGELAGIARSSERWQRCTCQPKLQSPFPSDPDTMRAALSTLGKQKEFGELSRSFLCPAGQRKPAVFPEQDVNTQLGDGMRFATMNQKAQFDHSALDDPHPGSVGDRRDVLS
jgi:hypothetical protein